MLSVTLLTERGRCSLIHWDFGLIHRSLYFVWTILLFRRTSPLRLPSCLLKLPSVDDRWKTDKKVCVFRRERTSVQQLAWNRTITQNNNFGKFLILMFPSLTRAYITRVTNMRGWRRPWLHMSCRVRAGEILWWCNEWARRDDLNLTICFSRKRVRNMPKTLLYKRFWPALAVLVNLASSWKLTLQEPWFSFLSSFGFRSVSL